MCFDDHSTGSSRVALSRDISNDSTVILIFYHFFMLGPSNRDRIHPIRSDRSNISRIRVAGQRRSLSLSMNYVARQRLDNFLFDRMYNCMYDCTNVHNMNR